MAEKTVSVSLHDLWLDSGDWSKVKPLFLLCMQHDPLLKRGFLAQNTAGSKLLLKSLLITLEIGQASIFGEHHET